MSERPARQAADPFAEAVERANEALDWIEARQGPLPADGYARVETTVAIVRALGRAVAQMEGGSEEGCRSEGNAGDISGTNCRLKCFLRAEASLSRTADAPCGSER